MALNMQSMNPNQQLRVLIISPVAVAYDAISTAARNTFLILQQYSDWKLSLITSRNEFNDVRANIVTDIMQLITDPEFLRADIIIYHFGIYHPFFDALLIGNGHAKQVVCFHNITPPEFVDPAARPLIDRSFQQLHNLRHADLILADSSINAEVLINRGIDPNKIEITPLVVDQPELVSLRSKPVTSIETLFVGRAVRSKGLVDCIEAFALACRDTATPLHLTIVGSATYSDPAYVAHCKDAIKRLGLSELVAFRGTLDDAMLSKAYQQAHVLIIPSYHEGFCVPVIEGLRAGCVPLGYSAGNLPSIMGGLGCLVAAGNVPALAQRLLQLSDAIAQGIVAPDIPHLPLDCGPTSVVEFDAKAKSYICQFSRERVATMTMSSLGKLIAGIRHTQ